MEKQRTYNFSKFCRRLLVILTLSHQLFAQDAVLVADRAGPKGKLYTNSDIEFSILLQGVNAADISVIEPQSELLQDARVRAIKKTGDKELKGTWIYVWYMFEKAGTYTLPDLLIKEKNRTRRLAFESVEIAENPLDKLPRIVIVFQNGTRIYSDKSEAFQSAPVTSGLAGKTLKFTVYAQYALALKSFDWDLPQNALFSKTKDYKAAENQQNASAELLPIADFEWESLKSGPQQLPRMKMKLTSFSGQDIDVIFPEFSVRFREGTTTLSGDKDLNLFSDAFSEDIKDDGPTPTSAKAGTSTSTEPGAKVSGLSREDCLTLAKLYRAEAKSLVSRHKAANERRNFEKEHGITPWLNRRIYLGDFGISLGCTLFSIPEEGASEVSYIKSGNALEVKESISSGTGSGAKVESGVEAGTGGETGGWLFVRFGQTEGWCKKDEVIVWTWETF